MGRKKRSQDLGRALAKKTRPGSSGQDDRNRGRGQNRHEGTADGASGGLASVLEASDLAELMLHAELAGQDFHTERGGVATLSVGSVVVGKTDTGAARRAGGERKLEKGKRAPLRIPRRPEWDGVGKEELERRERESFLEWRRSIAEVEKETESGSRWGMLTPFEKNLEVWRQLWRVLERSDVVVQIVDARNPLLYYCPDLKTYAGEELGRNVVLLVNKADLLSSNMITRWHSYFELRKVEVIFFSAFSASINEKAKDDRVLGVEELLEKLSSFPKTIPQTSSNSSERLVVGMVGYPNVGKSSTINVLLNHVYSGQADEAASSTSKSQHATVKRVAESSTPGRTKHFQTHHLSSRVTLCDCPGLVFPNFSTSKAELITSGVLPIDQMRGDSVSPVDLVARRIPRAILEGMYGIRFAAESPKYVKGRVFLETHARARGFMSDHDRPDISRSARLVLKDYVSGRLLFSHMPPPASIDSGEAGVGPSVFAKKGTLIRNREEVAHRAETWESVTNNESVETVAPQQGSNLGGASDELNGGTSHRPEPSKRGKRKNKPSRDGTDTGGVLARTAGRKKNGDSVFTRVERSYFRNEGM